MTEFKWSEKRLKAALMVAQDEETDERIAQIVGINRDTLTEWKRLPEFMARVEEHVQTFYETVRRFGIGRVESRVRRLDRTWHDLQQVIRDRATEAQTLAALNDALLEQSRKLGADDRQQLALSKELPGVAPGMQTGLVVKQYKVIGTGREAKQVEEFSVDTGLLGELRAIEKQAAQETGQWAERAESRDYDMSVLSDDELDRIVAGEPIERVYASARRRRARTAPPQSEQSED